MIRNLLCLAALGAVALSVSARHPMEGDAEEHPMHKHLRDNAPEGWEDDVPRFALFSKEGKFVLGIGGFAKVTAGVDLGSPIDNPDLFTTSSIPMDPAPGDRAQFNISAMQSHLFLNFVAFPGSKDQIGVFVGANFLDNYKPKLQYAYLQYRGIRAGYDYSLFTDVASLPSTIDYEGPCSATTVPMAVANYRYRFGKHKEWMVAAGIELPQASYTVSDASAKVRQAVPDIPVALRYSWHGGKSWVRASAILRNIYYHNEQTRKNVDVVGWGVQLSGTTQIAAGLRGYWQGVIGRGVASYIQDLNGEGMDLCPVAGGTLKPVKAWGAMGGLSYDITSRVQINGFYSHVRTYAEEYGGGATPWGEQYRYAQYMGGNVLWNISRIFATGVEYLYGRRMDYSGKQSHDNRIQAMLKVSF